MQILYQYLTQIANAVHIIVMFEVQKLKMRTYFYRSGNRQY